MLPYTNRARSEDKGQYELARSCTYDLMSVVVHVGEIDTGHYISYCRVGEQVSFRPHSTAQQMVVTRTWLQTLTSIKWFTFNDHRVELASKSDVLGAKAYLLFYIVRNVA